MEINNKNKIPKQYDIKCCHCKNIIGKLSKTDNGISVNSDIKNVTFRFLNNNIKIQCVCNKCNKNTSVTIENGVEFRLKIKENDWSL